MPPVEAQCELRRIRLLRARVPSACGRPVTSTPVVVAVGERGFGERLLPQLFRRLRPRHAARRPRRTHRMPPLCGGVDRGRRRTHARCPAVRGDFGGGAGVELGDS